MFLFFETPLTLSPRLALPVGARLVSSPVAAAAGPPVVDAALTEPTAEDGYRSRADLKRGIASFYDGSSALWERVWGEHMHHGYYPAGSKRKDHVQAQSDMIDEVLLWARGGGEAVPRRVLDVGCGVGGSTRHIARAFGCDGVGITLSPYQAKRANELSAAAGLGDQLSFQVADALEMPFPDESFDLVWSLESGEHMPDKEKFVSELTRVLRPGVLFLVAWTLAGNCPQTWPDISRRRPADPCRLDAQRPGRGRGACSPEIEIAPDRTRSHQITKTRHRLGRRRRAHPSLTLPRASHCPSRAGE